MKYLLLCCHDEKKWDSMSKNECDAVMEETMAYCAATSLGQNSSNR